MCARCGASEVIRSNHVLLAASWTQKKARAEATAALSDADGAGAAVLRRTAQFINRRALKVPSISVNGIITRGLDMQGMLPIVYQV